MRIIRKGREPRSLLEHRSADHANYENYAHKGDVRKALRAEQRGLCCYCLNRIPKAAAVKIEHWQSQSEFSESQLVYSNLLGACGGNEGQPWRSQHCDTRKGDWKLSLNPANPDDRVEDLIRYGADGRIFSNDPGFDGEMNQVLNLNEPRLKSNRRATLAGFLSALPPSGRLHRAMLEKWLRTWNGESDTGDLEPFCQVVIYWLWKRLSRP